MEWLSKIETTLGFTKYHVAILILYIVIIPTLIILLPGLLQYNFSLKNFKEVLLVSSITLFLFSIYILVLTRKRPYESKLKFSHITSAIMYSIAFAVPEEILFRGVIQGTFLSALTPEISIFVSSLIFGIAHIFNGAESVHPKNWNWRLAIVAFAGGLPLGWLFFLTESLLFPILLHAIFLTGFQIFVSRK